MSLGVSQGDLGTHLYTYVSTQVSAFRTLFIHGKVYNYIGVTYHKLVETKTYLAAPIGVAEALFSWMQLMPSAMLHLRVSQFIFRGVLACLDGITAAFAVMAAV